jgi:hypothetical protein
MRREKLIPQVRPSPASKRRVLNGIFISVVHPSAVRREATHHTASQLVLTSRPSLAIWVSARAPTALVANTKPLRRSAKVSSSTWKVSCSVPAKSLRISLTTTPDGSLSRQRAAM